MIDKLKSLIIKGWWIPILFLIFSIILFGISEIVKNNIFSDFCFWLNVIAILFLFLASFFQLINKNWIKGITSLVILGGTLFCIIFYAVSVFWDNVDLPDEFADNLIIPKNIQIYKPINLEFDGSSRPDSILNLKKDKMDFSLYNSFQPGLYEYDFWVEKLEKGKIYLKAFEITTNTELSKPNLKQKSTINVYNQSDSIIRICSKNDFTIYEGDWGKPYAARFEVWYKKDNSQEIKMLFTKNYIIEGWMR